MMTILEESPKISIVIPVLNESLFLGNLLRHLWQHCQNERALEIIVVDGGSSDNSSEIAEEFGATVVQSKKGRAIQMNTGAIHAKAEILYFLHADTFPERNFDHHIVEAIYKGSTAGCFRMRFDTKNPILRFFAWLSRINHTLCRGGDQSLFVLKSTFKQLGGFNEHYLIYEDSEFIRRLYNNGHFKVLQQHVVTSARKYRQKGWLRVQYHFAMIHIKNYLGAGPKELYRYYAEKLL